MRKHLYQWQHDVHRLACEKGWHERPVCDPVTGKVDTDRLLALLALIHSEVSEAVECAREGHIYAYMKAGKPMGLAIELADVVIRVLDLSDALRFSVEEAVEMKHEYNATRPRRHGGKLA